MRQSTWTTRNDCREIDIQQNHEFTSGVSENRALSLDSFFTPNYIIDLCRDNRESNRIRNIDKLYLSINYNNLIVVSGLLILQLSVQYTYKNYVNLFIED